MVGLLVSVAKLCRSRNVFLHFFELSFRAENGLWNVNSQADKGTRLQQETM
jgi:hypothetical protein